MQLLSDELPADVPETAHCMGLQEAAVRSLLVLARVHTGAGAHLAALPHLLAVLQHSSSLHFGLLVQPSVDDFMALQLMDAHFTSVPFFVSLTCSFQTRLSCYQET